MKTWRFLPKNEKHSSPPPPFPALLSRQIVRCDLLNLSLYTENRLAKQQKPSNSKHSTVIKSIFWLLGAFRRLFLSFTSFWRVVPTEHKKYRARNKNETRSIMMKNSACMYNSLSLSLLLHSNDDADDNNNRRDYGEISRLVKGNIMQTLLV